MIRRGTGAEAAPGLRFRIEFAAGNALLVAEPTELRSGVRMEELELALPPLSGRIELSPGSAAMRSAQTTLSSLRLHVDRRHLARLLRTPGIDGGAELDGDELLVWSWVGEPFCNGGIEARWRLVPPPLAPAGCVLLVPMSVIGAGPIGASAWQLAQRDLDRRLRALADAAPSVFSPRREGAMRVIPVAQFVLGRPLLGAGRKLPRVPSDLPIQWEIHEKSIAIRFGDRRGPTEADSLLAARIQTLGALAQVDEALASGAIDAALGLLEAAAASPGAHPVVAERLVDLLVASDAPAVRLRGAELLRALPGTSLGSWADGARTRTGAPVTTPDAGCAIPVLVALASAGDAGTERRLACARTALGMRPADPALQALCAEAAAAHEAAPSVPQSSSRTDEAEPGDDAIALAGRRAELAAAVDRARGDVERAAALEELGVFLYQDAGDDAAGLDALRSAFALAPAQASPRALSAAEAAARELGDREILLELFELRALREPEHVALWRLLRADTLASIGRLHEAIAAVGVLLEASDDPSPLRARRAAWRTHVGDAAGAADDLRILLRDSELDSFERIDHLRALVALPGIDAGERIGAMEAIVAAVPGDTATLTALVGALLDRNDATAALGHLSRRLGQLLGRSGETAPSEWSGIDLPGLDPETAEDVAALLAEALPALEHAEEETCAEQVARSLIEASEVAPGAAETAVEWARVTARFDIAADGAERLADLVFDEAEQAEWRDRALRWRRRVGGAPRPAGASVEASAIDAALEAIDGALASEAPDAALELVANWLPRVTAPIPRRALLLRRVRALLALGRHDEAQMPLRGAAILDPDAADVRIEQAAIALAGEQIERARDLLGQVAESVASGASLDAASSARLMRVRSAVEATTQKGTESS